MCGGSCYFKELLFSLYDKVRLTSHVSKNRLSSSIFRMLLVWIRFAGHFGSSPLASQSHWQSFDRSHLEEKEQHGTTTLGKQNLNTRTETETGQKHQLLHPRSSSSNPFSTNHCQQLRLGFAFRKPKIKKKGLLIGLKIQKSP